jgi:hypothetical protein
MRGRAFILATTKHEDVSEIIITVSRLHTLVPPSVLPVRKEISPEITKLDPCPGLPK